MLCCRLRIPLPLWPWVLYLWKSKKPLCVGEMCCQSAGVNVGGFYFSSFRLDLIKSYAGEKIIDLPEDTPYSFLMIDGSFSFIRFLFPLVWAKRIKDKTRSMCKCLLWSIYHGVIVFGTWQRYISLPTKNKDKIDLLNQSHCFFWILEDVCWSGCVLWLFTRSLNCLAVTFCSLLRITWNIFND